MPAASVRTWPDVRAAPKKRSLIIAAVRPAEMASLSASSALAGLSRARHLAPSLELHGRLQGVEIEALIPLGRRLSTTPRSRSNLTVSMSGTCFTSTTIFMRPQPFHPFDILALSSPAARGGSRAPGPHLPLAGHDPDGRDELHHFLDPAGEHPPGDAAGARGCRLFLTTGAADGARHLVGHRPVDEQRLPVAALRPAPTRGCRRRPW